MGMVRASIQLQSCSFVVVLLGLYLFLFKRTKKSPQTQMCPQEQDHFFNPSVGVSRCVCGALPSSFLRVGVDLDEDLELGGGSFQVLQGVRTQTCSGSSRCSDCWNCCTSAIVHVSTDALSMSEDTTCCRMCTNRQNILTTQHFTDCDKKKKRIGTFSRSQMLT